MMVRYNDLVFAVIVDVSHSRSHPDRPGLQRDVLSAFEAVNRHSSNFLQPLEATIGDEFQAVYGNLHAALRSTLLARLSLPQNVECRFGIGHGEIRDIGSSPIGAVQDGSAWWSARDAIDQARQHEYSKLDFVRTWYAEEVERPLAGPVVSRTHSQHSTIVNSLLLFRDQIIGSMNSRTRKLVFGHLAGRTQSEMADELDITQSAVSQALRKSGAEALIASESFPSVGMLR